MFFRALSQSFKSTSFTRLYIRYLTEQRTYKTIFVILECCTQIFLDVVSVKFLTFADAKKVQRITGYKQKNAQVLRDGSEN